MITRQELEGKWNDIKGRVQERWGQLTDDELMRARGNANQLVGVIEKKTGESRRAIEDFLEDAMSDAGSVVQDVAERARDFVETAGETAREQYDQVADSVRAGYEQAERYVQRNPVESVAVAFGAGIITGVIVGLVLKNR